MTTPDCLLPPTMRQHTMPAKISLLGTLGVCCAILHMLFLPSCWIITAMLKTKNGKCKNPSKKEYSAFTAFTLAAAVKGGKKYLDHKLVMETDDVQSPISQTHHCALSAFFNLFWVKLSTPVWCATFEGLKLMMGPQKIYIKWLKHAPFQSV